MKQKTREDVQSREMPTPSETRIMYHPSTKRTVTQHGDCLTIQFGAAYHNTRLDTPLTADDLSALSQIISSEARHAYLSGLEKGWAHCQDLHERAGHNAYDDVIGTPEDDPGYVNWSEEYDDLLTLPEEEE